MNKTGILWPAFSYLVLSAVTQAAAPFGKNELVRRDVPAVSRLSIYHGIAHSAALVRIRFPSGITPSALEMWTRSQAGTNYREQAYRDTIEKYPAYTGDESIRARIQDNIRKSEYYALEWYEHLLHRLPRDTVILEPFMIITSLGGSHLEGSRPDVPLPSVLEVDFEVDRNSAVDYSLDTITIQANTIGLWVSPQVVVATSVEAWPASSGVLFSAYDRKYTPPYSKKEHAAGVNCGCKERYATEFRQQRNPIHGMSLVFAPIEATPGKALPEYGKERVLGDLLLNRSMRGTRSPYQSQYQDFLEYLNSFVIESLNEVDPYLAVQEQWRNYLRTFDERVGNQWPANAGVERPRLQLIKKLMMAERKYLSHESQEYYTKEFNGDPGDAMREQLEAERSVMEHLEAIDQEQRTASSRLAGFEILNLISGHSLAKSNPKQSTQILANSIASAVQATHDITETHVAAVESVTNLFAPTFSSITPKIVEMSDDGASDNVTASVLSVDELRRQMRDFYMRRFPLSAHDLEGDCLRIKEKQQEDTTKINKTFVLLHVVADCTGGVTRGFEMVSAKSSGESEFYQGLHRIGDPAGILMGYADSEANGQAIRTVFYSDDNDDPLSGGITCFDPGETCLWMENGAIANEQKAKTRLTKTAMSDFERRKRDLKNTWTEFVKIE